MALLLGQPVAQKILTGVASRIREHKLTPGLAVLLIGDDPASHLYVSFKEKAAREAGIRLEKFLFPSSVEPQRIFEAIDRLNARADIHGILVQLPLPAGFPTDEIMARLDPKKDTDGFHQETMARFLGGDITACPVFPRAVFELLLSTGESFAGKTGLVLANSEILGKMMGKVLESFGMEGDYVLRQESEQVRLARMKEAHVIVTACGVPNLVRGEMIQKDAVIIDGGISEAPGGKVVGDVERESVQEKAAFLSPVPGGVGPVTVACLLARVTESALGKTRGTMEKS